MTVPKDKTYPTILTKADWKAKKKVGSVGGEPPSIYALAQMKINTGLGEALDQAQSAWKTIEFTKLSRRSAVVEHDDGWLTAAKTARSEAAKQLAADGAVTKAIAKLKAAKTKADAAGKAKLLSKQANTAAKAIAVALQTKITDLESITLTDLDQAVTDFENEIPLKRNTYAGGYNKVVSRLSGLKADPTKHGWDKADLKGEVAEAQTFSKQVAGIGVAEFRAARTTWEAMTTLTHNADEAVMGQDAAADKQVILKYLKDMNEKLKTVPSK